LFNILPLKILNKIKAKDNDSWVLKINKESFVIPNLLCKNMKLKEKIKQTIVIINISFIFNNKDNTIQIT